MSATDSMAKQNQDHSKEKATENKFKWFDLASSGVYLCPEMICGKPCVLLVDTSNLFHKHTNLNGQLELNGFIQIKSKYLSADSSLYALFTNSIDADFFRHHLHIPNRQIRVYEASLLDIRARFYQYANQLFNLRIDVLVKSALFLGINKKLNRTYETIFGRYTISDVLPNGEVNYQTEIVEPKRSPVFLRAASQSEIASCCEGLYSSATQSHRNLTIADVVKFASVLYRTNNALDERVLVEPYQILNVIKTYQAIFNKNTPDLLLKEFAGDPYSFLDSHESFKKGIALYEGCPSQPKAIYSNHLMNKHVTPIPLAFVMQRLLIGNNQTGDMSGILNPMAGAGVLTSILSHTQHNIVSIENDLNQYQFLKDQSGQDILTLQQDALETDYLSPFVQTANYSYVISSPACYKLSTNSIFTSGSKSLSLSRSDLVLTLKTLLGRSKKGRSVVLIPYFTDSSNDFFSSQEADVSNFLTFIANHYQLSAVMLSNDVYSKSINQIKPLLLVIGDQLETQIDCKDILSNIRKMVLNSYEELWSWASVFIYSKTDDVQKNEELRKSIKEEINKAIASGKYHTQVNNVSTQTESDDNDDDDDDFGLGQQESTPAENLPTVASLNAQFDLAKSNEKLPETNEGEEFS